MKLAVYLLLSTILSIYLKNANSHCVQQTISSLQLIDTFLQLAVDVISSNKIPAPGPMDCKEIQDKGNNKSGIYRVWPLNSETSRSFPVYCDMETDGGGWTTFQRRGKYNQPRDYFNKKWEYYSMGFGNLSEDFWLGNEKLYALTNQGNYSLRIDMKDKEGNKRYAFYKKFWIENEKYKYKLHVYDYSGNAGDSFRYSNGMSFSTNDNDNDESNTNCGGLWQSGWWFKSCHYSNLNGIYMDGNHTLFANGIIWKTWKGYYYSLPEVDMKIRRIN